MYRFSLYYNNHSCFFTGVWEQWDTIVYPKEAVTPHGVKVAPEGYLEIIVQKVQQNLGSDEDTISQQITDDPENQDLADERCLLIYLLSHRDKLVQYDFSSSAGVSQMVSTVHQIFEQLHNRQVGLLSAPADRIVCTRKVWNSQRLPMVMVTVCLSGQNPGSIHQHSVCVCVCVCLYDVCVHCVYDPRCRLCVTEDAAL